ncbi:hypothetical protein EDC94DRAFT_525519 [Helicostylum pulchrum]|nr:hypothetical protein EDC94DRAFT_525519 [Helicostylum pulchrum]
MKYSKKRQKHAYDTENYAPNPCPIWKTSIKRGYEVESLAGPSNRKRAKGDEKLHRDRALQEALDTEMIKRLTRKIKTCILQKGNTAQLKQTCLEQQRIEKGTVTDAEINNGLASGSVESYIRHNKKKNIAFWTDIVENNFDGILSQLQQENVAASEGSSRAKPENTVVNVVNMDTSRTCSVQFSTILREDLPEDISQWFQKTLKDSLRNTTNYLTDFSVRLYKIFLLLQQTTFEITSSNVIRLGAAKGVAINTILPDCLLIQGGRVSGAPL